MRRWLIGLLFFLGCATIQWRPEPPGVPNVPRVWGPKLAVVVVPFDAPPCALWTAYQAWELLAPSVPVIIRLGDDDPGFGRIVIRWQSPATMVPPNPDALGVTIQTFNRKLETAYAAETFVNHCEVRLLAHELGHALGLRDQDDPGSVMHWTYPGGGWRIDADERSILDATGELDLRP